MKKFKKIFILIILSLIGAILIGSLVIIILLTIIPSRDSEGHPIMPIFQMVAGWFCGIISFLLFIWLGYKKLSNFKTKHDS